MGTTTENFGRYDTANYLNDLADAAAYQEVVMEESDEPATVIGALGAIARSGNPCFDTILKVIKALGLRLRFESPA